MNKIISLLVVVIFLGSVSVPAISTGDDLTKEDFEKGSFSKDLDIFEYIRRHAEAVNGTTPPQTWNSSLVVNYVNEKGVKLLYMGLAGVSFGEAEIQLPLQSIVERFKTPAGDEAMTASTFLMLMAFNDTSTSLYTGSPDKQDNLWASFTEGTDFSQLLPEGKTPKLRTSVEVTPLTSSADKNTWSWGMKYKDLAAIWWSIKDSKSIPVAFCFYDELGFDYQLVYNLEEGKADLHISYSIGEMRDLWILGFKGFFPIITHYNDTGKYQFEKRVGDENIHDFLTANKISMSIVQAQRTWVADKVTQNKVGGSTASAEGVDASSGSIQTTTTDGGKVFDVVFGSKKTYELLGESGSENHDAVTRTAKVDFYAKNPVVKIQSSLLWGANALLAHMFPVKYAQNAKTWLNATKSDYIYVTSYPVYGGYKVVHDPIYTAYILPVKPASSGGVPVPTVAVLLGIAVSLLMIFKLKYRPNLTSKLT